MQNKNHFTWWPAGPLTVESYEMRDANKRNKYVSTFIYLQKKTLISKKVKALIK